MRGAAIVAAFLGWGVAAVLVDHILPNLSFIVGLALGAGAMYEREEK